MTAYRIANAERLYETAETRKIKNLAWVPTRNKHDGLGYRRMVREKDKAELFCAWNLILQVASKGCGAERWTLIRDGVPMTSEDLAAVTGFPAEMFTRAIDFFSSSNIGWLEALRDISGKHPDTSGFHPVEQNRTEQNRTDPPGTPSGDGDASKAKNPSEQALGITDQFVKSIASWKPDFGALAPSKINQTRMRWAADVDKMLRIDRRIPERVSAIIAWLPSHENMNGNGKAFRWREQILSGVKLREQYDKLDIAMNATRPSKAAVPVMTAEDLSRSRHAER